jgi:hypothetical protein
MTLIAAIVTWWHRLAQLLKLVALGKPAGEQEPAPEDGASKPPPTRVDALRQGMQKIRDDLAAFGTAVGLLAGSVTATTTFASFDDLFPLPAGWQWLFWPAVLLLFSAAAGSALLTRRYFAARRRIVVETPVLDPRGYRHIHARARAKPSDEDAILRAPLVALARGEGAAHIDDVGHRIKRLERVAARADQTGDSAVAALARAEAHRLSEALDLAVVEGAATLLEHRSAQVYKGWVTVALALVVVTGVGGLLLLADWSRGERDRITAWVACQKEVADTVQDEVCRHLDPRRLRDPSRPESPTPTPGPSTPGAGTPPATPPGPR